MSELASLHVSLSADTSSLVKGLDAAVKATEGFASKLDRVGTAMKDVGKELSMKLTAPLAAIGAASSKAAVDFETAFAGVRKTVDATEPELQAMEQGIRDMAKSIPATAVEIAGVAEAAGQLGIKKESIMGFTRTMIDLGNSTNMTADTAATQMARLANITQMPQTEFGRLGSTVVALGNNLATTEGEIVSMGLRLAGAGKQAGMSEAQVLGFAGALSSVGIMAESGGSAFSKVFKDMQVSVMTGNANLERFAAVSGMSVAQFKQAFEKDAASAVVSFTEGLGGISKAGGNTIGVLDALGFSDLQVSDALLRASNSGDLFRRSLEIGSKAWQENTALTKEAEQRYKTMQSKLDVVKNLITDAAITIGNDLIPIVKVMADGIAGAAKAFSSLDGTSRKVIIATGLVAAAIGPLIFVTGTLVTAWGTVSTAAVVMSAKMTTTVIPAMGRVAASFGTAVAAAAPWLLAAAAVGAAAIPIIKNWDILSQEFQVIWNNLSAGVASFYDTLKEAFSKVGTIVQKVAGYLGEKLGPVFDLLPDGAKRALEGTGAALGGLPDLIPTPVKAMAVGVGGALADTGEFIKFAVSQYAQDVKDVFGGMAAEAPKLVESMAAGIVQPVEAATATVNKLGDSASKALGDQIAAGGSTAKATLGEVSKAFSTLERDAAAATAAVLLPFSNRLTAVATAGKALQEIALKATVLGASFNAAGAQVQVLETELLELAKAGMHAGDRLYDHVAKQLDAARDQAKDFGKEVVTVKKVMGDWGKAADKLRKKGELLGDDFDTNAELARALHDSINEIATVGGPDAADAIQELRRQLVDLEPKQDAGALAMDKFRRSTSDVMAAVSGMREGLAVVGATFGVEIGGGFLDAAKKAGDFGLALVQLEEAGRTLMPAIVGAESGGGILGALGTLIPGAEGIFSALPGVASAALASMGQAISTAVAATGPVGMAIFGLLAAGALIIANWDDISQAVGESVGKMAESVSRDMGRMFDTASTVLEGLTDGLLRFLNEDWVGMRKVFDAVRGSIGQLKDGVAGIGQSMINARDSAVAWADQLRSLRGTLTSGMTDAFKGSIRGFLDGTKDLTRSLRDGVKNAIIDGIIEATLQKAVLQGSIGKLIDQFGYKLSLGDMAGASSVIEEIGREVPKTVAALEGMFAPLKNAITGAFTQPQLQEDYSKWAKSQGKVADAVSSDGSAFKTLPTFDDFAKAGMPQLAAGGIATGATAAIVGEGAYPEAILPLSRSNLSMLGEVIGQFTGSREQYAPAYAGGSGGTVNNHYHFNIENHGSPRDGEELMETFFKAARRKGLIH